MTLRTNSLLRSLLLVAVLFGVAATSGSAQLTRDAGGASGASAKGATSTAPGKYAFVGIGIDDYQDTLTWKRLNNAVNDVRAVREALTEKFHFESPDDWVLLNGNATKVHIDALFDTLGAQLDTAGIDNLVIYYAGHGALLPQTIGGRDAGNRGFLVPADANKPVQMARSRYIQLTELLDKIADLDVRHILVILDACYSGIALDGSIKKMHASEISSASRDLMGRQSRHVISSTLPDQVAADGAVGREKNSPFTRWLLEGLDQVTRLELPNQNGHEWVTTSDLFNFVRSRVSEERSSQIPAFGDFAFHEDGELVLTLGDMPLDPYRDALQALESDDRGRFRELVPQALADPGTTGRRREYLRYLIAMVEGNDSAVLEALVKLSEMAKAGEARPRDIPMTAGELQMQLSRAERVCAKLVCARGGR